MSGRANGAAGAGGIRPPRGYCPAQPHAAASVCPAGFAWPFNDVCGSLPYKPLTPRFGRVMSRSMIWIIFATVTACVILAVARPLRRAAAPGAGTVSEMQTYKLQLAELNRDEERGTLGKEEAEQTRTEISRRLLKAQPAQRRGCSFRQTGLLKCERSVLCVGGNDRGRSHGALLGVWNAQHERPAA